jgi:hypothetical protein
VKIPTIQVGADVIPWPVKAACRHDLRGICDYLSAIPQIPANTCGTPSE